MLSMHLPETGLNSLFLVYIKFKNMILIVVNV